MQRKLTIFYSWQSDLPGKDNRYFIQTSIDRAVKNLNNRAIAISADRDTSGKTGTPDVVQTIFDKIDEADIFVADISIINMDSAGKKTPNPNVLLELGYAAKAIGWDRIICVFNTDYGSPENLPFDLKTRRILPYSLRDSEKSQVRNTIGGIIERTVEILITEEMIPNQSADIRKNKETLADILKIGIYNAWVSYYRRKEDIFDAMYDEKFVVITESHFKMIENIREFLTKEQYFLLHDTLDLLRKMRNGSEEAAGWEIATLFVERYFEPLYLEYFNIMHQVELMNVLKKEVLDLYNCLLPKDEKITYKAARYTETGKLIFLTEPHHQEAYDNKNDLLCKVDLDDEGRISGWKRTDEYTGEYQQGKRCGNGIEYGYDLTYRYYKKREGTWENDTFIDGIVFGVVMHYEEEGYGWLDDENGLPCTQDWEYLRDMLRSEGPKNCRDYYLADLKLKNGEYDIVEGTLTPLCAQLGGPLECCCTECEME